MNPRSITILASATALVAAVAAITLHHGDSSVKGIPPAGQLFPSLAGSFGDVATIEIKRKDGTTTLQRAGDGWGLAEKGGYPVDMASVRKTVIGASELKAAEARTEDPKMYSKLGVEDPGTEGSTSTLLTLKDANGAELASLIVGKEHTGKGFTGARQVYVRKPGESKSWLATGELDLKEKSADWLDKKILEVKRDRIRAAEIRHADGEIVLVDRDKPETKDFTLHDIPEGQELAYPSAPSSVADALGYLNLEDVLPAAEMDVKEGASGTAKFSCFDGLTITVTTKTAGEKTYARFEASYEQPPEASGPPPPPSPVEAEPKQDDDAAASPAGEPKTAEEKPKAKTPEEVQKEAADLNARLSKWVYQIPSYNKSSFEKKKAELLKPPPSAPLESSPATPPGSEETPATPPSPVEPPKEETPKPPHFGG